jgi:hypothetical protein
MEHRLIRKKFVKNGFDEFNHDTLNVILPEPELFSSETQTGKFFFKRINDLTRTKFRFFIFNDVYIHFYKTFLQKEFNSENGSELKKCFEAIIKGIEFRVDILLKIKNDPSYLFHINEDDMERINVFLGIIIGTVFISESISELFPGSFFKKNPLKNKYQIDFFYEVINEVSRNSYLSENIQKILKGSFYYSVEKILSGKKWYFEPDENHISTSFIHSIYKKIYNLGQKKRADEWMGLAKNSGNLIELDILDQGNDFQFNINIKKINLLLSYIRLAENKNVIITDEDIYLLKSEAVLRKSLKENFLPFSNVRIPLYSKWLKVSPMFKNHFNDEFNIDCYISNEEFIASVISKFLAIKSTGVHSELLGTGIFNGYIDTLEDIIPENILCFSKWMFGGNKF